MPKHFIGISVRVARNPCITSKNIVRFDNETFFFN